MRSATAQVRHNATPSPFGAIVADEVNPTLRRRELGFLLRKLRTDRGLSVDEVTTSLLFSPTKLSRLETGRSGASARDIRDLYILYQVTDPAERDRLMALAREGKQRAWWQSYGLRYETYIGLEANASTISDYNSDLVTGLLQTPDYARAVFKVAEPPMEQAAIDQGVEVRLKRQELLKQPSCPRLHFILNEEALYRPIGGAAVMRGQLARITEISSLNKVTFQLLPLKAGAHPAFDSTFVLLHFDEPTVNDVAYLESLAGDLYHEGTGILERFRKIFARLHSMALSPEESLAEIARIAADTYPESGLGP